METLPANFAIEYRKALDSYQINHDEFVTSILHLAELTAFARRCFPSNEEFGQWLFANGLDDLGKNDRAALIGMGQHLEITRVVLETTNRRSVRLIWEEEVVPRLPRTGNTTSVSTAEPEPAPIAAHPAESVTSVVPEEPVADVHEPPPPPTPQPREVDLPAKPVRHVIGTLPNATLVLAHHLSPKTRTYLGTLKSKKGFSALWALLVESIEQGTFGEPTSTNFSSPNLRLVLPWADPSHAARYVLPRDTQQVRDDVLPVVRAHPEIKATPHLLPKLVQERYAAQHQKQATERRRETAAASGEKPVIVYGVALWPDPPGPWTYQELLSAWWFWQFLARQFPKDWSAESRTIQTHQLLRWIPTTHGTGWALAVRKISTLYRNNSDVPSEVPPPPPNYGL